MRITTVIGGLTGGGAERVCANLVNAWVDRGWDVTLLTVAQNSLSSAYSIDSRVERRDVGWPRSPRDEELNIASILTQGLEQAGCPELVAEINLISMIRAAILATKPDVVVAHIDMTNVRVLAAMQGTNVPVIACEHTDLNQIYLPRWQAARKALYRSAVAVVASHAASADWLARSGARAYAIHNPLVGPPPVKLKRKGERRRVVSVGRISPEKRPALMVRAFASIADDFPTWDLEVYGVGPLREPLAGLANELAPGRIHVRGFTKDVYTILTGADLFVSSSWVEGFGNSIWEALACGVPVVATDCGAAVRTLVRDGIDGLIVRERGIRGLAAALASLMKDDARRSVFAARAPEVVTRFSFESSLAAWDVLLRNTVA